MFDYIKGTLVELTPEKAIVEANGIGYSILIPLSSFSSKLKCGKEVKLFLSPVYREDSQKLFGFTTIDERSLFEKLSSVSGIGPKTALSLIGHMSMQELNGAIMSSNAKLLAKVPGIGKKTAERVIIDLRDKIHAKPKSSQIPLVNPEDHMLSDGVNALINLGYNHDKAHKAISQALDNEEDPKLETLIKSALQLI